MRIPTPLRRAAKANREAPPAHVTVNVIQDPSINVDDLVAQVNKFLDRAEGSGL